MRGTGGGGGLVLPDDRMPDSTFRTSSKTGSAELSSVSASKVEGTVQNACYRSSSSSLAGLSLCKTSQAKESQNRQPSFPDQRKKSKIRKRTSSRRILQQLGVYCLSWQLDIAHYTPPDERILDRGLPSSQPTGPTLRQSQEQSSNQGRGGAPCEDVARGRAPGSSRVGC